MQVSDEFELSCLEMPWHFPCFCFISYKGTLRGICYSNFQDLSCSYVEEQPHLLQIPIATLATNYYKHCLKTTQIYDPIVLKVWQVITSVKFRHHKDCSFLDALGDSLLPLFFPDSISFSHFLSGGCLPSSQSQNIAYLMILPSHRSL